MMKANLRTMKLMVTTALFASMASACIYSDSKFDTNLCAFSKCYSDYQCSSGTCIDFSNDVQFCMLPVWGVILTAIGILLVIVGAILLCCCCCACCCCARRRKQLQLIEEHHYYGVSQVQQPDNDVVAHQYMGQGQVQHAVYQNQQDHNAYLPQTSNKMH